jgi:formate dehydrogenase
VALAAEMSLAMTEVYEVATFYHHFDVVKDGERSAASLTVRCLRDALVPDGRIAGACMTPRRNACGSDVRVIGAPCIGRCEHAPAAVVGRNPIDRATPEAIMKAIAAGQTDRRADYIDYAAIARRVDTRRISLRARRACRRRRRQDDGGFEPARPGRRGFPVGRKWKIVRAEPAPRLMAVNIDEGEPARSRIATTSSATRTASSKAC